MKWMLFSMNRFTACDTPSVNLLTAFYVQQIAEIEFPCVPWNIECNWTGHLATMYFFAGNQQVPGKCDVHSITLFVPTQRKIHCWGTNLFSCLGAMI